MRARPSQSASQAIGFTRPARAPSTAAGMATIARAQSKVLKPSLLTIPSSWTPAGMTAAVKRATTRASRDSGSQRSRPTQTTTSRPIPSSADSQPIAPIPHPSLISVATIR